jgi:transcriptional regulator with XRE-family HTH domain
MELSDLITRYRKESQLTIDELAEQSGVPKGTLTKIIGRITKAPSLETVKAIAHALGKTLADFDDESVSVDPLQEALLDSFLKLNQEGKERLVETADDMVSSGKYMTTRPIPMARAAARGGGIKTIPADAADAVSREMIPTDNDLL